MHSTVFVYRVDKTSTKQRKRLSPLNVSLGTAFRKTAGKNRTQLYSLWCQFFVYISLDIAVKLEAPSRGDSVGVDLVVVERFTFLQLRTTELKMRFIDIEDMNIMQAVYVLN